MTPWTVAHQAPLSMEFSRQEYWSQLPFPSPGDLSDPGITPGSPVLESDSLPSESPGKPHNRVTTLYNLTRILSDGPEFDSWHAGILYDSELITHISTP